MKSVVLNGVSVLLEQLEAKLQNAERFRREAQIKQQMA